MRRLFWMGVGAVAGVTGTVWAERKVKAQLDALQPDALVVTAGHKAKAVGRSVVDAVVDGRGAMREREAELRYHYGRDDAADRRHRAGGATRPMTSTWPSTPSSRHRP